MAVAFLFAFAGTVSSLFGIVLVTMHAAGGEATGISLNGWLVLFGWACYAMSSIRGLEVARGHWISGRDALWPLVWSMYTAAITLGLASAIGPELLGTIVPGAHPWAPVVIVGLAAGCVFAASALILERIVARTVRLAQTLTAR